ncbi:hypothetical protein AK830_g5551 [Neonectria ditissima]|uniref:C2H2-type domain-containing protein n=1 Tax=Neonectria ditissima TaxID=78410 RepID=A0A0P7BKW6_9HYPO|nr:hypothetical protein AK830_g5551 [Neonectria ditissima]
MATGKLSRPYGHLKPQDKPGISAGIAGICHFSASAQNSPVMVDSHPVDCPAGQLQQAPDSKRKREEDEEQNKKVKGLHRKRVRQGNGNGDNYNDDEDNDDNNSHGSNNHDGTGGQNSARTEERPLLACPFYKFEDHVYFSCTHFDLRRPSDVKQHIERRHVQDKVKYCPKCYETFKTAKARDAHVQGCSKVDPRTPDLLSRTEFEKLKRMPHRLGEVGQWNWLWDQLFSGHPRPESPYIKEGLAECAYVLGHGKEARIAKELTRLLRQKGLHLPGDAASSITKNIYLEIFEVTERFRFRRYRCHPEDGLIDTQASSETQLVPAHGQYQSARDDIDLTGDGINTSLWPLHHRHHASNEFYNSQVTNQSLLPDGIIAGPRLQEQAQVCLVPDELGPAVYTNGNQDSVDAVSKGLDFDLRDTTTMDYFATGGMEHSFQGQGNLDCVGSSGMQTALIPNDPVLRSIGLDYTASSSLNGNQLDTLTRRLPEATQWILPCSQSTAHTSDISSQGWINPATHGPPPRSTTVPLPSNDNTVGSSLVSSNSWSHQRDERQVSRLGTPYVYIGKEHEPGFQDSIL